MAEKLKNGDEVQAGETKYRVIDDELFEIKSGSPPTNTTSTYTFTINYTCPYQNACSDNGKKCETCKHNPKRSYYEPVEPCIPYIPYVPYYPSWPYYWQPTIWYGTTCSGSTCESHYQESNNG